MENETDFRESDYALIFLNTGHSTDGTEDLGFCRE